jgi:LPXTG-motif cell wall-anchored protein
VTRPPTTVAPTTTTTAAPQVLPAVINRPELPRTGSNPKPLALLGGLLILLGGVLFAAGWRPAEIRLRRRR